MAGIPARSSCEYFNLGEGFEAKIKQLPEHFIVDELSSFNGEAIQMSNPPESFDNNTDARLKRSAKTPIDSVSEKRPRSSIENGCIKDPGTAAVIEDHTNHSSKERYQYDDLEWCKKKLNEILDDEALSNLEMYAKQTISQITESAKEVGCVSIGTFSCRDERTFVHRCVRLLYPFLKTVTKPHSGQVSLTPCPNYRKFSQVVGHEMAGKIFRFIHVETFEDLKKEMTVQGQYGKDERRKIHHLISSCFGKFMETRTLTSSGDGAQRVISIRRKPHLIKTKQPTNEDIGIITAFTLWKKNCETYAAIQHLGRHLHIPHNMFNFAGIKDKRAVTTQKCTVSGISPEKFEAVCQSLPDFLKVSDCRQVFRAIRLGELNGNRFCVKLVKICPVPSDAQESLSLQDIHSAIENVKTTGFVNYFGPQRFGRQVIDLKENEDLPLTLEAPAIGLAMLQSNFKRAVDVLLAPVKSPSPKSAADLAKKHFQETRNVEETIAMMPSQKLRELSILRTLKRFGATDNNACANALLGLPHSARLLYLHSFSSHVWNEMATLRIRKFGKRVIEGDLVRKSEASSSSKSNEVAVVTKDDVDQNVYTIDDIVLPVPGSQVCYPPCLEVEYRDMLQKFLVGSNQMFRIPALKMYAPGAYRKLIESPRNLSLEILPHETSSKDKHGRKKSQQKDLKTKESHNADKVQPSADTEIDAADRSLPWYKNFDIELKFDLPPSCYATTFLSEVTKGHLK